MSPCVTNPSSNHCGASLTEEHVTQWHPARISDQKLASLRDRLERLKNLGGAFAELEFSESLQPRVEQLDRRTASRS